MREGLVPAPLSPFLPSSFVPSFCPVQFVVNSQLFFVLFFFSLFPSFPTTFFQFTAPIHHHMVPSWSPCGREQSSLLISTPPLGDVVFSRSRIFLFPFHLVCSPSSFSTVFPVVYLFSSVFFFVFIVFSFLPSFPSSLVFHLLIISFDL